MRMIGIGLLGFLLAGIALLLSTMNILEKGQRYVREITTGPQLVFEYRAPAQVFLRRGNFLYAAAREVRATASAPHPPAQPA